ncbi:MAG: hypothetical protein ACLUE6_01100 [Acutalibacteraceae bacterium]
MYVIFIATSRAETLCMRSGGNSRDRPQTLTKEQAVQLFLINMLHYTIKQKKCTATKIQLNSDA